MRTTNEAEESEAVEEFYTLMKTLVDLFAGILIDIFSLLPTTHCRSMHLHFID